MKKRHNTTLKTDFAAISRPNFTTLKMKKTLIIRRLCEGLKRSNTEYFAGNFGSEGFQVCALGLDLNFIFYPDQRVRVYKMYRAGYWPKSAKKPIFRHREDLSDLGLKLWRSEVISEKTAVLIFGIDRASVRIITFDTPLSAAA
jgi:hypothetical protein